jgi:hypothetical protein
MTQTPRPFRVHDGLTEYIIIAIPDDGDDLTPSWSIADIFLFHPKRVLGERVYLHNVPDHIRREIESIMSNPLL